MVTRTKSETLPQSIKSLKTVIAVEVRKVEEFAATVAVHLGFEAGGKLMDDFWFERLNCPEGTGPAGVARSRCLDALATTLEVDTNVADWIEQIERALKVLRRNLSKAAPRPNAAVLKRAEAGDQGWEGYLRANHELGKALLERQASRELLN